MISKYFINPSIYDAPTKEDLLTILDCVNILKYERSDKTSISYIDNNLVLHWGSGKYIRNIAYIADNGYIQFDKKLNVDIVLLITLYFKQHNNKVVEIE